MRNIEITATTYIDGGVCCLSGRTATYRTSILRDPDFQWKFTHEFWRGKYHQHSGDDKFLTRWMHSHAWKTYIQACPEAELASTFKDNWRFLLQLLRWTRNTWRSDFRSLFVERHVWTRYPFVAFCMFDKIWNPLTLIAGPATVAYLCTKPERNFEVWVIIVSYIVWLLLSRLIKYIPHFIKRPQDVLAIPVWLVFNIYFAFLKVYCLFTLHVTEWGTRKGADHNKSNTDEMEIYVPHWDEPEPLSVTAVGAGLGAGLGAGGVGADGSGGEAFRPSVTPVVVDANPYSPAIYANKPGSTVRINLPDVATPVRSDSTEGAASPYRRAASPTRPSAVAEEVPARR